jgi:GTP cyclohydrolase IB
VLSIDPSSKTGAPAPDKKQETMKDVQSQKDLRNIAIDRVGVKGIKYPITVLDKAYGQQQTIASINMYVDLPREYKGTHMSRFIEMLHGFRNEMSLKSFSVILGEMKKQLNAQSAHIEVRFPYFIEKKAPVSGSPGMMNYDCAFIATSDANDISDILVEVKVPITSVCPCSKEISEYGAHNQRGEVCLTTRFKELLWMEDMIALVESSASCEVYSILKRSDEKLVTEKAFSNPKFVEDIVRDIAVKVEADKNITWYSISVENFESIHNHSAFAYIRSD